jgi:hypothetical protein
LACASVFRAVIGLFGAICLVQGRAGRVLVMQAAVFLLVLGLTLTLGRGNGLVGVGLAWLIANALVALAVTPATIGVLRASRRTLTPGSTLAHRKKA